VEEWRDGAVLRRPHVVQLPRDAAGRISEPKAAQKNALMRSQMAPRAHEACGRELHPRRSITVARVGPLWWLRSSHTHSSAISSAHASRVALSLIVAPVDLMRSTVARLQSPCG